MSDNASRVQVEPFTFQAEGHVDASSRSMVRLRVPAWRQSAEGADAATLYRQWQPVHRLPTTVTLIPYFAWSNRGENEMRVFLDVD